jgi:hypothetical protein
MVLSFLAGGAVGYLLGTRAGRERYRDLVRLGHRVAASQTTQAAAGVLRAQVDTAREQARHAVADRLRGH